ncbi:hypothetical protein NDU88_004522 [Pleurodeles waltl]|uniref:Uncharacterized protein n=1 Tax=Pleurodeles waltl TaxID=8319 RepID=A0AAV7L6Y9_PLEWA|nr:hypothetical protein NDU88_004522 [Pleurodeles waltl]
MLTRAKTESIHMNHDSRLIHRAGTCPRRRFTPSTKQMNHGCARFQACSHTTNARLREGLVIISVTEALLSSSVLGRATGPTRVTG